MLVSLYDVSALLKMSNVFPNNHFLPAAIFGTHLLCETPHNNLRTIPHTKLIAATHRNHIPASDTKSQTAHQKEKNEKVLC